MLQRSIAPKIRFPGDAYPWIGRKFATICTQRKGCGSCWQKIKRLVLLSLSIWSSPAVRDRKGTCWKPIVFPLHLYAVTITFPTITNILNRV